MTTQKETIIWHKYPEEKPSAFGLYLIDHWAEPVGLWINAHWKMELGEEVRAWTELPKGWQKVNKNDNLKK